MWAGPPPRLSPVSPHTTSTTSFTPSAAHPADRREPGCLTHGSHLAMGGRGGVRLHHADSLKRYHSNGDDHFLTFSCHRRETLLSEDALRAYFLLSLERLRARHRFMVFGYVLMPEHVHLLVSGPPQFALSKVIGSLKTAVSRRSSQQQAAPRSNRPWAAAIR